jgi:hypothetical protein
MTDDGILDLKALQVWLSERGLARGSIQARRIGDGHSNFTYAVEDRERTVVVRCPPPPPTPPGANDVLREARLLQALAPTPVPVPAVLAVGGTSARCSGTRPSHFGSSPSCSSTAGAGTWPAPVTPTTPTLCASTGCWPLHAARCE